MEQSTEIFVGIDISKARNAIAVAPEGRNGEVRYVGEVDSSVDSMRRFIKRITAKHPQAHFCYEAGPTGYGLHRLIVSIGSLAPWWRPRSFRVSQVIGSRPTVATRLRSPSCFGPVN